jgi:uncharacterized membrane protein (Fun14 family)
MNESAVSGNNDILSSGFLFGNLGAPFVLGLAVGYFTKKMLRLALFVGGGITVGLLLAEYYGVINVSNDMLLHAADSATQAAKDSGSFLIDRLTTITSRGVSATGGFYLGFKMG